MKLFEYATLRVVPRVERGEFLNVGVLLYCQDLAHLDAAVRVDEARLLALHPGVDAAAVAEGLDAVCRTTTGEGPAGETSLGQRFRWLVAPRSTVLQTGPVHTGWTDDPAAELVRLVESLTG